MLIATLRYRCSGCDAAEDRDTEIKHEFRSFSGKDYGVGSYSYLSQRELVRETVPQDWIPFDPYTNTTYCPKCWAEIVRED